MRNLGFFTLIILFLFGCRMNRDAEIFYFPSEMDLVVYTTIQPDSIAFLALTVTSGIDEYNEVNQDILDLLRQSEVTISDELGNEWKLEYVPRLELPDYYFGSTGQVDRNVIFKTHKPNVISTGSKFELIIHTPEFGSFSASTTMPDSLGARAIELKLNMEILNCETDDCGKSFRGNKSLNRLVFEIEETNEDRYFILAGYDVMFDAPRPAISHFSINLPVQKEFLFTDPDGTRRAEEPFPYIELVGFTNETFKGQSFDLVVNFVVSQGIPLSTTITIDLFALYSVDAAYYDYIRLVGLQKSTYYLPFSEPVFIPTNIENGQGFFGGMRLLAIQPVTHRGQEFLAQ